MTTESTGTQRVDRHVALAVPSRRRLLDVLHSTGRALGVEELAVAVGRHVTTTRHHLLTLERAGLVARSSAPAQGPGRPRQLYAPARPAHVEESRHKLTEVLVAAVARDADGGRARAEDAGRTWAAQELPETRTTSFDEAVQETHDLFDRLGFAPRLVRTGDEHRLELAACPFRALARAHPEAVCSVHLGLLRGALQRRGIPEARAGLRPFVEPEFCVASVARAAPPPPEPAAGGSRPG